MEKREINNMTINSIEQMRTVDVQFNIITDQRYSKKEIRDILGGFIKIGIENIDSLISIDKIGESYEDKYKIKIKGYICCQEHHSENEIISYGKNTIRKVIGQNQGIKLDSPIEYKVMNKYDVDETRPHEIFSNLSN